MNLNSFFYILIVGIYLGLFSSCSKDDSVDLIQQNNNVPTTTPSSTIITFDSLVFNRTNQFFGVDLNSRLNLNRPLSSFEVQSFVKEIEITFIYNTDYHMVGFMDPLTRSKNWYWDNHYLSWLDSSNQTKFYQTNLNESNFLDAKNEVVKIQDYFALLSDSNLIYNPIFPNGSCIGGRAGRSSSTPMSRGDVYAFSLEQGKRGLMFIRMDQSDTVSWDRNWHPYNKEAKVDIIREK